MKDDNEFLLVRGKDLFIRPLSPSEVVDLLLQGKPKQTRTRREAKKKCELCDGEFYGAGMKAHKKMHDRKAQEAYKAKKGI